MGARPARRFTVADMMALVAAAAAGLVALPVLERETAPMAGFRAAPVWRFGVLTSPFAVAAAVALLALRARGPVARPRRVFRQPGTVACVALVFNALVRSFLILGFVALAPQAGVRFRTAAYFASTLAGGYSVALAWGLLALLGAWRPVPDWIDRAGRALGALLIAVWVLTGLGL